MRRPLPILLACAALAMAGCGGGDDNEGATEPAAGTAEQTGTPAASGSADVTVTMKDIKFDPAAVTVKAGGTIQWKNEDSVNHDAVAKEGDVPKSGLFGEGETYEAKFDTPGTIEYVCTVHPGMEGTITVE
jgi:plastocyanin